MPRDQTATSIASHCHYSLIKPNLLLYSEILDLNWWNWQKLVISPPFSFNFRCNFDVWEEISVCRVISNSKWETSTANTQTISTSRHSGDITNSTNTKMWYLNSVKARIKRHHSAEVASVDINYQITCKMNSIDMESRPRPNRIVCVMPNDWYIHLFEREMATH